MGIITRLLHRSEGLSPNRFNAFLFDTGENIHLHYRDLRVEFSVDEFIEFHDLCLQYLPQLKKFIDEGYRDGVHPNTNQASTWRQFTTRKPLVNGVRYHPTRISLEENSDGYHVHIRNYKILLDKPSFLALVSGAREALEKRETNIDVPEALELLTVNDLPNRVDQLRETEEGWQAQATVERAYFRKACQVLDAVGFRHEGNIGGASEYIKDGAWIRIRPGTLRKPAGPATSLVSLATYLREKGRGIDAEEFTRIKLQVLDTVGRLQKQGRQGSAEMHYSGLFYDATAGRVVLPARLDDSPQSLRDCLVALDRFASELGIRPSKPAKIPYSEEEQAQTERAFERFLHDKIISHPCVKAVYRFGGVDREKPSGTYDIPYVHFDWVKLGSDFDLLIEIDEAYPVPQEWDLKFHWEPAGSGYYHLGDVDHRIESSFIAEYPGIEFRHHLVEAYLFLPSKGSAERKREFIAKHSGKCIFRRESAPADADEAIQRALLSRYGLPGPVSVIGMPSPGFNTLYRVSTGAGGFVAKLMDRSDFTPGHPGHRGEHLGYEAEVLGALRVTGSDVAVLPLPGADGRLLQPVEGRECMLFPFVDSQSVSEPAPEHSRAAATALAMFHAQVEAIPEGLGAHYAFETLVDYELSHLRSGMARVRASPVLPLLQRVLSAAESVRDPILRDVHLSRIHCHGDVCPRNFFFTPHGAILHDYQMFVRGPRISDVAEGALEFALSEEGIDPVRVRHFIDAYGSAGALSEAETERMPQMLLLQSAFRLARILRVSLDFGYKLNGRRLRAFAGFAELLMDGEFPGAVRSAAS
jgi:Ser/Thr protein kinase RdoA (MazF antagonist)